MDHLREIFIKNETGIEEAEMAKLDSLSVIEESEGSPVEKVDNGGKLYHEVFLISNFSKNILFKNKKLFKSISHCSYTKYFDRAVGFVSYLESYVYNVRIANDIDKLTPVSIHSDVLDKFFASPTNAYKVKKILVDLGIIRAVKGFHISDDFCMTSLYYPLFQEKKTAVKAIDNVYANILKDSVDRYYADHGGKYSEQYKKLFEDYKHLYVNFEKADKIFKEVYGYSLDDVRGLFYKDSWTMNEHKAMNTYNSLAMIQSKSMHYKVAHGRVYTPFHSLKKEFRACLEMEHSEIVEAFDVSACFPRIVTSMLVSVHQTKNNWLAKSIRELDQYLSNGGDLYSLIEGDRKTVKSAILYYLFSANHTKQWLYSLFYKYDSLSDSEKKYMLDGVESILSLDYNTISGDGISKSNCEYREFMDKLLSLCEVNRRFDNDYDYYRAIINSSRYLRNAIKYIPIFKAMNESPDARIRAFSIGANILSGIITDKNRTKRDIISTYLKNFKSDSTFLVPTMTEISRCGIITNLSIEAQKIESAIFIEGLLPYLRSQYPECTFISLHDAIYCSKKDATVISGFDFEKAFNVLLRAVCDKWKKNFDETY